MAVSTYVLSDADKDDIAERVVAKLKAMYPIYHVVRNKPTAEENRILSECLKATHSIGSLQTYSSDCSECGAAEGTFHEYNCRKRERSERDLMARRAGQLAFKRPAGAKWVQCSVCKGHVDELYWRRDGGMACATCSTTTEPRDEATREVMIYQDAIIGVDPAQPGADKTVRTEITMQHVWLEVSPSMHRYGPYQVFRKKYRGNDTWEVSKDGGKLDWFYDLDAAKAFVEGSASK